MKTTKYIICMLLACVALYGCQEIEEPVNNIPTVNTYEVASYGTTTATLTGNWSDSWKSNSLKFILSTSADFSDDCIEFGATWNGDKRKNRYEAKATGLSSNMTYYCKLVYADDRGMIEGNVVSFTTKSRFEFNSISPYSWGGDEPKEEFAEGSTIGSFFYYNDQFGISNVKSAYNGSQWIPDKDVTPAEQMMIYSYSPYTESYEMSGNQILIPVSNDGTDYLYGVSEYVASENTPTDLYMHHAMSRIRFTIQKTKDCDIEGTVCEVQIVNADNANLCANGWLHLTTGDIEPSGEYLDLVGIGCKFELSDNTPTTVERLMFPTSFGENQLKIGVKIAQTNEVIYTYLPAGEWKKGNTYNYPITLTKIEEELTEGDAIDLGLSVMWASKNVGASLPEEYGDYFAWGETEEKDNYFSSNSLTYGLSTSELQSRGIIDADGNLTSSYDVAATKRGGDWRMPTLAEIQELRDKCTWKWTTQNGVNGRKVTGPNGNTIFLPATGIRSGADFFSDGAVGWYWSATLRDDFAFNFRFGSDYYYQDVNTRYEGFTVRPVYDPQTTTALIVGDVQVENWGTNNEGGTIIVQQ